MRREMRDKSESGISDKKIFSYYQYDSFRDEKIIGIVMSSNLKEAEKNCEEPLQECLSWRFYREWMED